MALLPIILFFISFRDLFSLSIQCPKSKVDQGGSLLNEVKEILESRGFVLISGKDMKKLLVQQGATEEDMAVLESGYIHKHLPMDQQPVMHHRQVTVTMWRIIPELSLKLIPFCVDLLSPRASKHNGQHHLQGEHPHHHPVPP